LHLAFRGQFYRDAQPYYDRAANENKISSRPTWHGGLCLALAVSRLFAAGKVVGRRWATFFGAEGCFGSVESYLSGLVYKADMWLLHDVTTYSRLVAVLEMVC
jgi:hypothetical protein